MNNLVLNGGGYRGLEFHMQDALKEKGLDPKDASWTPPVAIFAKQYCDDIDTLDHTKKHDFCFIGSISSCHHERAWVIDFAKKYFTSNSVFVNTDNNPNWTLLGEFDVSNKSLGYCPKAQGNNQSRSVQYRVVEENRFYFETMCQSTFVLCPAGDAPWSFRFYETLMCKSVPLVKTWHHTYRTREEATFPYKYVLADKIADFLGKPCDDIVEENTKLFQEKHLLH